MLSGRVPGPLSEYLQRDHALIDRLLDEAVRDPDRFDHGAFERARARLLRHIGIEEKILLPDAKRRAGGEPLAVARRLRRDHGAIASLLVPTPDHALVRELRSILREHDPLEEGPDGVYATCERLAGSDVHELLRRAEAAPEVPLAKHFDGPRATRSAADALARSAESLEHAERRRERGPGDD